MSLTLHFHPLSSFCQKVVIALYENGTHFTPRLVDLGDPEQRTALLKLWPMGRFPVLQDGARGRIVPESSIIIEYLDQTYPGALRLIPDDADLTLEVRLQDRFFDIYLNETIQKIVGDRIRPADGKDPTGVEQARKRLQTAYDVLEHTLAGRCWAAGDAFTMADCAAAPALYYSELVLPFRDTHKAVAAYFDRLLERPSYMRVLREAAPYLHMFPRG